jgi:hypothetical protein
MPNLCFYCIVLQPMPAWFMNQSSHLFNAKESVSNLRLISFTSPWWWLHVSRHSSLLLYHQTVLTYATCIVFKPKMCIWKVQCVRYANFIYFIILHVRLRLWKLQLHNIVGKVSYERKMCDFLCNLQALFWTQLWDLDFHIFDMASYHCLLLIHCKMLQISAVR